MSFFPDVNQVLLPFAITSGGVSFMDALPDPMKLDIFQVGFVVILVSLLYFFLKSFLFKPLVSLMDERESAIQAGATSRLEAAQQVEKSQSLFDLRLREMRIKAFEHRKSLTAAANLERQRLLESTRLEASRERQVALAAINKQAQSAEADLRLQVDQLSEKLALHLLKQA